MENRPVATSSEPHNTPGTYPPPPSGAPPGFNGPNQYSEYSHPSQQHNPSAPYLGPDYGPPPPGVIPGISSQPPIEQLAGPANYPTPYSQQASMTEVPRPTATLNPLAPASQDLKSVKTSTQFALREYIALQKKRGRLEGAASSELEDQIRNQGRVLLGDLKTLRKGVAVVIKDAESHRWRNWLIGGAVATFIPAVKKVFRRSSSDKSENQASNSTEYAFSRSKALVARIKDTLLGRNSFASIAFFVFAVLYVFTNEVSLQVAKTVSKRLKRLSSKIERGDAEVVEQDMKLLEGWRWRVLMWGQ
ncbi:hypothetical protein CCHL11_09400 [Colletotrichum chlorophyti]|uniref:Uncharacterized protein n=1 Tax=Colletotrichum chlorophyti TaxID=708187 RepID=A0A1Q8RA72_9PEZI|nr:hypothetical protein CCHL11_09400 [Colletotrichum chlorophyti]